MKNVDKYYAYYTFRVLVFISQSSFDKHHFTLDVLILECNGAYEIRQPLEYVSKNYLSHGEISQRVTH